MGNYSKNPFKKKSNKKLIDRINFCKKIIGKNNFIKIKTLLKNPLGVNDYR